MKKLGIVFLMLFIVLCTALPASAADGTVTYDGNAKQFIFAPGSDYSPTDLFPNFKGVMPGDSLTQAITVKNDASNKVKVKIYMRSLGAHADSEAFLSQLHLRVEKAADNEMGYMFDAAADETAGLTDWVCLGTLYAGGEVDINVILDVPTALDTTYSDRVGYLDWEFKIEEFPTESTDPTPPKTGDGFQYVPWIIVLICSAAVMSILILWHRKKRKDQNGAQN